uniref:FAD-dependent oxidoreductase n=1 Tax=Schlesneria paludicola TaxID=360056 RepID=A0A7C4LKJ4_9PLAN
MVLVYASGTRLVNASSTRVVIVGGGLAGLATATALAAEQVPVLLVESRPRWGGRASSFFDHVSQEWIDNCQHVAMGCCTNFRQFCTRTGLDGCFRTEPALYFVAPEGRIHRCAAGPWPAPFHLAGAFARFSFLSGSDKRALAYGLWALARGTAADPHESMAQWLNRHHQPPRVVRYFWQVILVSALSESLERMAVAAARQVIVQGFLAHRRAWEVWLPAVPLEELYGGRLTQWLSARGVEMRLLAAAEGVEIDDGLVQGVRLKSGEVVRGSHYVLAVPWHRAAALFPPVWQSHSVLANLDRLESSPISSVHLWFDRPVLSLPHAVFVEGLCQWVFQRPVVSPQTPSHAGRHYLQVVISASRGVRERTAEDVLQQVLSELSAVWPAVKGAGLTHWRLVTEQRAVFAPLPAADAWRPPQQSPWPNLQFAGDWTRTGWPATMEGAVRSGYLAAENILRQLGRDTRVLQPDLPTTGLARSLLGLRS